MDHKFDLSAFKGTSNGLGEDIYSKMADMSESERKKYFGKLQKVGLASPTPDGLFTEIGESVMQGATEWVGGVGKTMTELGLGDGLERAVDDYQSRHMDRRPYTGYAPSKSFTSLSALGRTIGSGIGSTLPSIALSAIPGVGPYAGFMATAASIYGDRVRQMRELLPDAGNETVYGAALLTSCVESLIEQGLGSQRMVSAWAKGGSKVVSNSAKASVLAALRESVKKNGENALMRIGKAIVMGGAEEGFEETLQDASLNITAKLFGSEAPMDFSQTLENTIAGFVSGGAMGGAVNAAFGRRRSGITVTNTDGTKVEMSPQALADTAYLGGTISEKNARRAGVPVSATALAAHQAIVDDANAGAFTSKGGTDFENLAPEQKAKNLENGRKFVDMVNGLRMSDGKGEQLLVVMDDAVVDNASGKANEQLTTPLDKKMIDGFRNGNVIYLRGDGRDVTRILGHEMKHWIDSNHADLAKQFDSDIESYINNAGRKALADTIEKYKGDEKIGKQEFMADMFGSVLSNGKWAKSFAGKLEAKKPGLGARFIQAAKQFLDSFISYVKGKPEYKDQADQLVAKYQKVSDNLGTLLNELVKRGEGAYNEKAGAMVNATNAVLQKRVDEKATKDAKEEERRARKREAFNTRHMEKEQARMHEAMESEAKRTALASNAEKAQSSVDSYTESQANAKAREVRGPKVDGKAENEKRNERISRTNRRLKQFDNMISKWAIKDPEFRRLHNDTLASLDNAKEEMNLDEINRILDQFFPVVSEYNRQNGKKAQEKRVAQEARDARAESIAKEKADADARAKEEADFNAELEEEARNRAEEEAKRNAEYEAEFGKMLAEDEAETKALEEMYRKEEANKKKESTAKKTAVKKESTAKKTAVKKERTVKVKTEKEARDADKVEEASEYVRQNLTRFNSKASINDRELNNLKHRTYDVEMKYDIIRHYLANNEITSKTLDNRILKGLIGLNPAYKYTSTDRDFELTGNKMLGRAMNSAPVFVKPLSKPLKQKKVSPVQAVRNSCNDEGTRPFLEYVLVDGNNVVAVDGRVLTVTDNTQKLSDGLYKADGSGFEKVKVDGKYPNYKKILEEYENGKYKTFDTSIEDWERIMPSLVRLSKLSDASVPVAIHAGGKNIVFNAEYLAKAFSPISALGLDKATLKVKDEKSPIIVSSGSTRTIVMPLRGEFYGEGVHILVGDGEVRELTVDEYKDMVNWKNAPRNESKAKKESKPSTVEKAEANANPFASVTPKPFKYNKNGDKARAEVFARTTQESFDDAIAQGVKDSSSNERDLYNKMTPEEKSAFAREVAQVVSDRYGAEDWVDYNSEEEDAAFAVRISAQELLEQRQKEQADKSVDGVEYDDEEFNEEPQFSVRVTPKQDVDYMDAVKRGDMDTAQRMVREAAANAMPNTKAVGDDGLPLVVYHGTPFGGWNKWNTEGRKGIVSGWSRGNTISLTTNIEVANDYSKLLQKTVSIRDLMVRINKSLDNVAEKIDDLEDSGEEVTSYFDYESMWDYASGFIEYPDEMDFQNDDGDFIEGGEEKYNKLRDEAERKGYLEAIEESLNNIKNATEDEEILNAVSSSLNILKEQRIEFFPEVKQLFVNIENPIVLSSEQNHESYMDTMGKAEEGIKKGHDGAIIHLPGEGTRILATLPSQIKSIGVTYDDKGNVIPLSKRFNSENDDIRFSTRSTDARTKQVNPVIPGSPNYKERQDQLDNATHERHADADVLEKAEKTIQRSGSVKDFVDDILNGNIEVKGDIVQTAVRLVQNSEKFYGLPDETRLAFYEKDTAVGTDLAQQFRQRRIDIHKPEDLKALLRRIVDEDSLKRRKEGKNKGKTLAEIISEATGVDPLNIPDEVLTDPVKRDEYLRNVSASLKGRMDKAYEYWVNAILSSPTTHAANTIGNLSNVLYELGPKRLAEIMVSSLPFMRTKTNQGARFGEYRAMLKNVNWRKAWADAKHAFNFEMDDFDGKFMENGPAIGGKLGRNIRLPGRFLKCADAIVKSMVQPMEASAMAYREGVSKGLDGDALENYIEKQLSDANSNANYFGSRRALELTFQEDTGATVRWMMGAKNSSMVTKFLFPFVKTPYNIIMQSIRKGPLGIVPTGIEMAKVFSGKAQMDAQFIEHVAEQIVFWTAAMALMGMHGGDDEPWLTGSMDARYGTGEYEFKNKNIPPNSIRIGDHWLSYSRIEPLASSLSVFADGMNALKKANDGDKTTSALKTMMFGIAKNLKDKSYLHTFQELNELLEDTEKQGSRMVSNFVASWVPNAYRSFVNSMQDEIPNYRNRESGVEWWKKFFMDTVSRAGLARKTPKLDYFGREVKKDDSESTLNALAWRLLLPVQKKASDMDRMDEMFWEYNRENPDEAYYPSLPNPTGTIDGKKVTFTSHYDEFVERSGKLAYKMMQTAVQRGEINTSRPRKEDISRVKAIFTNARRQVREEMYRKGRYDK